MPPSPSGNGDVRGVEGDGDATAVGTVGGNGEEEGVGEGTGEGEGEGRSCELKSGREDVEFNSFVLIPSAIHKEEYEKEVTDKIIISNNDARRVLSYKIVPNSLHNLNPPKKEE